MNLTNARKYAKKAAESLYEGTCTCYCKTKAKDTDGSSIMTDTVVFEDVPCRMSQEAFNSIAMSDGYGSDDVSIKIFIQPDLTIPEGSILSVTQNSITARFHLSSKPRVYITHQEISLELEKRYA